MENPFLEKHIITSVEIVRSYLFDKPFHLYLKEVFRNHKNWGSKDRRNYKKYCYLILKNAGSLGAYLHSEIHDFHEQWKLHWDDLPVYYWPLCLLHPDTISKLNLIELNYFHWGIDSDNQNHSDYNDKYSSFGDDNFGDDKPHFNNSAIDSQNFAEFKKINSIEHYAIYSSINHADWINSYSRKVSPFNKAIVNWIFELEKGNRVWNAYSALQFSMSQLIDDSGIKHQNHFENRDSGINHQNHLENHDSGIKYQDHFKNHKNFLSKSISRGIDVSKINEWFLKEAPVFYLDKHTGTNQEFPPNSPVNEWVDNGLGIIQDRSSTQSIEFLLKYISKENLVSNLKVWDCCSGAGGKSLSFQIQFQHQFKNANPKNHRELFQSNWICTDVRETIIDNLKKRFKLLDLIQPLAFQLDLLNNTIESFDTNILESNLILADLPCSGSGTWRRTPEELLKTISVMQFAERQFHIMENIIKIKSQMRNRSPYFIYYMTCSVFAMENEKNIELLLQKHPNLECLWQNFFGGYLENADFIYGALIKVN